MAQWVRCRDCGEWTRVEMQEEEGCFCEVCCRPLPFDSDPGDPIDEVDLCDVLRDELESALDPEVL